VTITVRTLAIGVTLFVVATVGGVVLLLHGGAQEAAAARLSLGVPVVVSPDRIGSLTGSATPIYWAGAFPQTRLEVTTTKTGSFVRYLPPSAPVGTKSRTLTIATYAVPNAWRVALRAAREQGAHRASLPDGQLAVWRAGRPTSVYLARRGSSTLVEVFDPDAARARHLSLSGLVQPVPTAR